MRLRSMTEEVSINLPLKAVMGTKLNFKDLSQQGQHLFMLFIRILPHLKISRQMTRCHFPFLQTRLLM